MGRNLSGNVLSDGVNQYLYDGEGRICAVSTTVLGAPTMTGYVYDAGGARVSKGTITAMSCDPGASGFVTKNEYVVGPGGEQVTEMTRGTDGTMGWAHTNVWAGGSLIATYDTTGNGLHFYLSDWLGTRRVQTDSLGGKEQTCSSLPFGDGLSCTNSSQSPTEQHFTGKERDTETNNDYFGARYYASSMGRFLSPDPLYFEFHRLVDPQQLNLYAYGRNNPLHYRDSTGLDVNLDCSNVSSDACKKTVGDLNNRKGAQFSVSRNDKTGLLQADGKVDPSNLSSGEAALYGAISDTDHHATLSVVSESGDVQFGRFDGNGHNTLDRSDLNLLGNASPQAAGQVIAHEALEAYDSSFLPSSMPSDAVYGIAHGYATQFFGEGDTTAPVPILNSNPAAFTQNWTLTGLGSTFTVRTVPATPQPDYNQRGFIQGKMTDIWPAVQ